MKLEIKSLWSRLTKQFSKQQRSKKIKRIDYFNKRDPQESDPKTRKIIKEVAARVEKEWKDAGNAEFILGSCHVKWSRMKAILMEEYQIDWKTPQEMNPSTCFD